jgi:hypothetical protein
VKLGAELITSLSQDTKNARLCNARYSFVRNKVLEDHPWRFATKTVELASIDEDTYTPSMDWQYGFQLPSDFLRVIRGESWKQEFEIHDGYLNANDDPFILKYTFECTNTGLYSISFAECVSWLLASDLAYAITRSTTVAETMYKGYQMSLREARYNDAHKMSPQGPVADSFVDVRN